MPARGFFRLLAHLVVAILVLLVTHAQSEDITPTSDMSTVKNTASD